jgi:hypothetical protein
MNSFIHSPQDIFGKFSENNASVPGLPETYTQRAYWLVDYTVKRGAVIINQQQKRLPCLMQLVATQILFVEKKQIKATPNGVKAC